MIEKLLNKYTFILFSLFFLHIITVSINGILTRFDYILIVFILTMSCADEDNFVWLAVIFGLFSDYVRGGYFGPAVGLFIIFYLFRFRTDAVMDMTKLHYRVLFFSSLSLIYCMFNLLLNSYSFGTSLSIAIGRTILNVAIILLINIFFKGYCIAAKNS